VTDWGGGISVVLHRGSNCSPSRAMDGRIMCRGIISSCQSAATSEIVKRCCLSLVSSATASTETFTFLPFHQSLATWPIYATVTDNYAQNSMHTMTLTKVPGVNLKFPEFSRI